jgi:hypothetical protein
MALVSGKYYFAIVDAPCCKLNVAHTTKKVG